MERQKIDVRNIALLAKLELSDEETVRLEAEMKDFDDFAKCLCGISGTEAIDDALPLADCHAREDGLCRFEDTEKILNGAKSTYGGYITVPRTVKDGKKE